MLTYKTSVEKPRLVISYDHNAESPREWTNLGYFFSKQSRYNSPDGNKHPLYNIMIETADEADNQDDHIKRIIKEAKKQGIKVLAVYPVYCYEHSSIVYRRGTAEGWDYSNNGYYIITNETLKEHGAKKAEWLKTIDQELETYTQWANGEVYEFTLFDKDGNLEDSCSGFYSIDDIKEHLPEEFKDEDLKDYLA